MSDTFLEVAHRMVRWYMSLYRCRAKVLNHLFCTIGNGYDWQDGSLTDGEADEGERLADFENLNRWAAANHQQVAESLTAFASQHGLEVKPMAAFEPDVIPTAEQILATLADIGHPHDIRTKQDRLQREAFALGSFPKITTVFYPLNRYSRCRTVPDDVRPDWLAACRECMHMVIRWDTPEQVKFAQDVLQDLERRFGPERHQASYTPRT